MAGAAGLRGDLDNAFRMFDPDMRFSDGSSGGIGTINLQDKGIINDNFADKSLNALANWSLSVGTSWLE